MKNLLYIIVAALAFCLGWCGHSSLPDKPIKYDTIVSDPIVVTKIKVDTQYILSPFPYLAWIDHTDTIRTDRSGVAPRLDELRIYPKTVYETKYIYRDVISKPKRWGIGLSAGYGVGKNGLSPVLAVTVNYNLFQF